jgi:hypothetical protein
MLPPGNRMWQLIYPDSLSQVSKLVLEAYPQSPNTNQFQTYISITTALTRSQLTKGRSRPK